MKVWVICQNDFPDSVWSDKEAADKYLAARITEEGKSRTIANRIRSYWHVHEFIVKSK